MAGTPHERQLAMDFIRAHPDDNNVEVARKLNLSKRTVAYARATLRAAGELPAGRRTAPKSGSEDDKALAQSIAQIGTVVAPLSGEVAPTTPSTLPNLPSPLPIVLDDGNVDPDEDEESIRRRIIAVAREFALNPLLHPDTRLSASTVYMKLKDALKAKELGPGKPLTKEQAISRLSSLLRATGPDIALEAISRAFNLGATVNGTVQSLSETADAADPAPPPPETTGAPGSAPPV